MTPRELAELRDQVARAKLADDLQEAAVETATAKPEPAAEKPKPRKRRSRRRELRYPVTGRSSIIECPVHQLVVALDEDGRICSTCPACDREAAQALEAMAA